VPDASPFEASPEVPDALAAGWQQQESTFFFASVQKSLPSRWTQQQLSTTVPVREQRSFPALACFEAQTCLPSQQLFFAPSRRRTRSGQEQRKPQAHDTVQHISSISRGRSRPFCP
jgi:hypothetical protein